MASPVSDPGEHVHLQPQPTESVSEAAVREAQRWIEAVTGRSFGEKDFRGGLDNGILLCELLSSIKPGLVKKINRLPTPVAGLDNLALFLRGCEELGLKGSQLFDPGDLQDSAGRNNNKKGSDCNRKLKNVLITIYWLGRAANSSATYNGPTLDLHEFEGLLSQMRKEVEDWDSPKRSIRDSGYIDCWESERSDSLSPPRHARDDSFDSLDSIGSRSRHTPSPDGLLARTSSDGRGSDSECDVPHRKLPDMRKDDMLARRTSCSEPRTAVPFNQYLPNKSNQTGYMPTPLRRQRTEQEDSRKSWSNATSPIGGERPFSESQCLALELSPAVSSVDAQCVDPAPDNTPFENDNYDVSYTENNLCPHGDVTNPLPKTPHTTDAHPKDPPCPSFETQQPENVAAKEEEGQRGVASNTHCHNLIFSIPHAPIESPSTMESGEKLPKLSEAPLPISSTQPNDSEKLHHQYTNSDTRSMSMIDMRSEEEAMLPPHSHVRHELMHGQYTRMKEEESHWQDDLARWKSRRRSVSQDLIKKEEERKMMERLQNCEEFSQRRKSIKTYKEIVEDKERRERELHEAYLKAKTPMEAAAVLERYAQRFTISEAILERLKLPRLLERSVSVDPARLSTSPTTPDSFTPSNPLQYLRQQSLPAPKFTSTVEARVPRYGAELGDTSGASDLTHSDRSAPLLASKPYSHSRTAGARVRSAKRDEMERVNGETDEDHNAREEQEGKERRSKRDSFPLVFYPSCSQSANSDNTEDPSEPQSSNRYTTPHTQTHAPQAQCVERADSEAAGQRVVPETQRQEDEDTKREQPPSRPTSLPTTLPVEEEEVPHARGMSPPPPKEESRTAAVLLESEQSPEEQNKESTAVVSKNGTVQTAEAKQATSQVDTATNQISKQILESPQKTTYQPEVASIEQTKPKPVCGPPETELANSAQLTPLSSNPKLRWDFFTSSEPAEKQHGNEKYQREQEKLKQEWEQAQKEVEEEERRYHEEERKILEETVAPLTPHSPIPPSPCWQEPTPINSTPKQHSIICSMADWEHKQEELEKQAETLDNKKQRENERHATAGTNEVSESSQQPSCEKLVGHTNGQREGTGEQKQDPDQLQTNQSFSLNSKPHQQQQSEPWQKTASSDCSRNTQPTSGGRRRSDSIENVGANSSSHADTQQPPQSPNRSVSGKKLCSSCGHPLGKGAAMIIETLSLYFHIQCFKCGICKGQLGDTTTGTDVRIRNGLLNCHQCYIRSRSAGQPTTL